MWWLRKESLVLWSVFTSQHAVYVISFKLTFLHGCELLQFDIYAIVTIGLTFSTYKG